MDQQNAVMARPKKKPPATPLKRKYVEIRPAFLRGLEIVAAQLGADDTEAVNTLIREGLERRKLWPPSGEPDSD